MKFNGGFHYKTWDYQCPSYLRLFDLDLGKEFSLLEEENTKAVQAAKEAASLLPDFHRLHYFLIHTTTHLTLDKDKTAASCGTKIDFNGFLGVDDITLLNAGIMLPLSNQMKLKLITVISMESIRSNPW